MSGFFFLKKKDILQTSLNVKVSNSKQKVATVVRRNLVDKTSFS